MDLNSYVCEVVLVNLVNLAIGSVVERRRSYEFKDHFDFTVFSFHESWLCIF